MGLTTKSQGKKTTIFARNGSSYAEMTDIVNSLIELHEVLFENDYLVIIGYTLNSGARTIAKGIKINDSDDCEGNRYCKIVFCDLNEEFLESLANLDCELDCELV